MKSKMNSIGFIVIFSFVALIIITFSIIGVVVFSNWNHSVENIIAKIELDTKEDILIRIDDFVSIPLSLNEANHGLIERSVVDINNKKSREMFFAGVIQSSPAEVYSFSFGTENGEYYGARRNLKNEIEIMENNAATGGKSRYYAATKDLTAGQLVEETGVFDPRTRDWYKAAKASQTPVFSPIYKHFVMDDLALSAACPIYSRDGSLIGVLGAHITLSRINTYLKDLLKDRVATSYIIEESTGELVANSLEIRNFSNQADSTVKRLKIEDIAQTSELSAYKKFKAGAGSSFTEMDSNDRIHVTFTEINAQDLNWLLVTSIPESQLTADIKNSILLSIFLSLLALLIAISVYINRIGLVLKPIYHLTDVTERFSKGDFSQRATVFKNDEVGKLSDSFNKMAQELNVLIYNLEGKVKERTEDLEVTNSALRKSEGDMRLILDSAAEAIFGIDTNGICTFCNVSCLHMLGYQHQDELVGKRVDQIVHRKSTDNPPSVDEEKLLNILLMGVKTPAQNDVLFRTDGSCFPVEYYSYPQYSGGEAVGAVVTFMDITERKKSEEEILYLSYHDQLTDLFNRRYFEEEYIRLDKAENLPLSIIQADMNGLKLINDSFGHAIGDRFLIKAAQVFQSCCRAGDVISRLGGDEFVILLPNTTETEAEHIIKKIKELAAGEKVNSVDLSISFGLSTKTNPGEEMKDILKKAEDLMYRNKLIESPSMRGRTVNTIISTLYSNNKGEEIHARKVSELCKNIGEALGMPSGDIEELKTIGLLHDIGKFAINESILSKPDKLTEEEWEDVKRHSETGYRLLSSVEGISDLAAFVLAHHERWDGAGYPKGLKGEEIPLKSRIVAIAEAYETMTGKKCYRSVLNEAIALDELKRNAGTQFDPVLIKVFVDKVIKK